MNGSRMRELRETAGLFQVEVGLELDLDNDTICQWEINDREIPKVYAEAFNRLVNDVERVHYIKASRRARRRKNRVGGLL